MYKIIWVPLQYRVDGLSPKKKNKTGAQITRKMKYCQMNSNCVVEVHQLYGYFSSLEALQKPGINAEYIYKWTEKSVP
jgi:hypothetical protein